MPKREKKGAGFKFLIFPPKQIFQARFKQIYQRQNLEYKSKSISYLYYLVIHQDNNVRTKTLRSDQPQVC